MKSQQRQQRLSRIHLSCGIVVTSFHVSSDEDVLDY